MEAPPLGLDPLVSRLAGATLGGLLIGFIQAFNEGLTIWSLGSDWTRSVRLFRVCVEYFSGDRDQL